MSRKILKRRKKPSRHRGMRARVLLKKRKFSNLQETWLSRWQKLQKRKNSSFKLRDLSPKNLRQEINKYSRRKRKCSQRPSSISQRRKQCRQRSSKNKSRVLRLSHCLTSKTSCLSPSALTFRVRKPKTTSSSTSKNCRSTSWDNTICSCSKSATKPSQS